MQATRREHLIRTWYVGLAALTLGVVGACAHRDDARTLADRTDSGVAATATVSGQRDAQIMAMLSEVNEAEIAAARVALHKALHADVKAFARQMIADHAAMLQQRRMLGTMLNMSPESPIPDTVMQHARQEAQTLRSAAPGRVFDKVYLDAQLRDHQSVLAMLQQLKGQAQHPELKTLITNAEPMMQQHFEQAQRVDRQLATSP